MLVTTLVAAAVAIYFGYQAWHAGFDPGSISKLMSSIPFDVAFIIGGSAAVVAIGTTVYSIYQYCQNRGVTENTPYCQKREVTENTQYCQNRGVTENTSEEDIPYLCGAPISFPPGYDPQKLPHNGITFHKYCALIDSLNSAIGCQILADKHDSELEVDQQTIVQLAIHYEWMLYVLPVLPAKAAVLTTKEIYENGAGEFIAATERLIESWRSKIGENKLITDEKQALYALQINLRQLNYTLIQLEHLTLTKKIHEKLLEKNIDLRIPVPHEFLNVPSHELHLIKGLHELYSLIAKGAIQEDVEAYIGYWVETTANHLQTKVTLPNLGECILEIIQSLKEGGGFSQLFQIEMLREKIQFLTIEINTKFGR